ncbi:hypothetical protein [Ohessyouella blattaphilus]|uniref:Response receiver domain-containing protein n=1 Tax=Ohessyouella blattaphilus TaxID=2949333 RepID=A0ABT1EL75_9FIRM|nr:hypothetical protein [Ohessyouella blattaphilus]MCP1111459.1 hypothetical protein [Ohessyouella blattaphilus]MCR8564853.1 hypothetical protein [Ohessyouella blattaphilus]
MDIKELLKGIAVIIDDEVENPKSDIYTIKEEIKSQDIPVATYTNIPDEGIIPSLSSSAFIVFDWDYMTFPEEEVSYDPTETVMMPEALGEDNKRKLISFIRNLLSKIFVPVFIFTNQGLSEIESSLEEEGLWSKGESNRIFLKRKGDLLSADELFVEIKNWLKSMPSAYVLKEWDKVVAAAKNQLFLDMYGCSSNWVTIMWNQLKNDSIENEYEFGEFITTNMKNRISGYSFNEEFLTKEQNYNKEELIRIVEGERYVSYGDSVPKQLYTGDLYKEDDNRTYFLCVQAQCDLARVDTTRDGEIQMLCIKGTKQKHKTIVTDDIVLNENGNLVIGNDKYEIKELQDIINDSVRLKQFNKKVKEYRNKTFYNKGELLEKKNEALISCVAGEALIKFKFNYEDGRVGFYIKNYHEYKDKRIGRILPPHITKIQQKFTQYINREGTMPIPIEIFEVME